MEQMFQGKDLLSDEVLSQEPPALPDEVGELAIDVVDDDDTITIQAPMAGVKPENLDLSITDETVTIKGSRHAEHEEKKPHYLVQECYWGAFERTFTLPVAVDSEKARAILKNGLLMVTIPKAHKSKTKSIEVKAE
jgi:HSP20 family protein